MSLIPLRGCEDDPDVRTLLGHAHGAPERVEDAVRRYRSRDWILVGWAEADDLLGCAGLERDGDGDLVLHSVAVRPDRRGRGIGRALVDAIAGVATARRLVAQTDEDAVGFYGRCGFAIEPTEPKDGRARFRCVRLLRSRPLAAADVRAFTLGELEQAIREAWSRDTSDDPDEWSEQNPTRGQCAVTSLLVRELLGGEILVAGVARDGVRFDRHAWNRLPSGLTLDLTRSQFRPGDELEQPHPIEPAFVERDRYELFAARVRARLGL